MKMDTQEVIVVKILFTQKEVGQMKIILQI